jgi:hypothetical protein
MSEVTMGSTWTNFFSLPIVTKNDTLEDEDDYLSE